MVHIIEIKGLLERSIQKYLFTTVHSHQELVEIDSSRIVVIDFTQHLSHLEIDSELILTNIYQLRGLDDSIIVAVDCSEDMT